MEVRLPFLAALLMGILFLVSCQEKVPAEQVPVTFSLMQEDGADGTRAESSGESEIRRWALLLFQDGRFVDFSLSNSPDPITRTMPAGTYVAYAVANYPESSFHPEAFRVTEDLTEGTVDLFDNTPGAPVMFGKTDLTVPSGQSPSISVERLVCKAGIRKVSVDLTDPSLAGQPFVLKGIFLTNCCRSTRYGADPSLENLSESKSDWYHPMGQELSGNALLAASGLDSAITPQTPYRVTHSFLYYPNPTSPDSDTHATGWSPRCTRMVLEAQIGNRTCYYPVTLPPISRNRTCMAEEAIIRRVGSADPEQEIPDAVEIVFNATLQPWEQQYNDKDAY